MTNDKATKVLGMAIDEFISFAEENEELSTNEHMTKGMAFLMFVYSELMRQHVDELAKMVKEALEEALEEGS